MAALPRRQPCFEGRTHRSQRFAVVSFPGEYEPEWVECTTGQTALAEEKRLALSCVFFPDGSHTYHGAHSAHCKCSELYSGNGGGHPDFHKWPQQQAPWGCKWYGRWKANVEDVSDFHQVAVIVYKDGHVNDDIAGLGFSQRGEVAYVRRCCPALETVSTDVSTFMKIILPLTETPDRFATESAIEVRYELEALLKRHHDLCARCSALRQQVVDLRQQADDAERQAHEAEQELADLEGVPAVRSLLPLPVLVHWRACWL